MINNKINNNYSTPFSLLDLHKAQALFEKKLKEELQEHLNLIEIRKPAFKIHEPGPSLSLLAETRPITFDGVMNRNIYMTYDNFQKWSIASLGSLNLLNNEGIIYSGKEIHRDNELSNVTSIENNSINITYIYENDSILKTKVLELAKIVYKSLYFAANEVVREKLINNHHFEKKIQIEDVESIKKSKITFSGKRLFDELTSEYGNVILEMAEKDPITRKETRFANISSYSKHLRSSYDMVKLSSVRITKNNEKSGVILIEIDIDKSFMSAFEIAHILELQSGKKSSTVEKFLKQKNIQHL